MATWLLMLVLLSPACASPPVDRAAMRDKVREMFFHAYDAYMTHAYPADELMPLSCKGRVRGVDPDRGDIDEALGRFSLTLVDTLDTLALLNVTEFLLSVERVIGVVRFDANLVVSTFETNIRMLGGLLGAHSVMLDLAKQQRSGRLTVAGAPGHFLRAYTRGLLDLAIDLGDRLMVAFDTPTGLPYSRVNLARGIDDNLRRHDITCTACAGSMLLEFGALSRYSGNGRYEEAARRAMEALWSRRGVGSDLVGTTINITSGNWLRTDTGVGAGIDSYYEYLLKSYVFLGDQEYLDIFNTHYAAITRYLKKGPFLVDAHMHSPLVMSRRFMDALQTFWPGLQVLKGDLTAAIEIHEMYTHLVSEHGFVPESFTSDFKVNWAASPIRPEFVESTYFLYRATGDPHYLEVGRSIVEAIDRHTRVPCGFAALLDVRSRAHEDKLDSFVLAETFKYLFLLFEEHDALPIDLDDYIFTTEAHLLPLGLGSVRLDMNPFSQPLPAPLLNAPTHDSQCSNPAKTPAIFLRMTGAAPRLCPRYDLDGEPPGNAHLRHGVPAARRAGLKVPTSLRPEDLNVYDEGHQAFLNSIGIFVEMQNQGIRLLQLDDPSNPRYEKGRQFLADLVAAQNAALERQRSAVTVRVVSPSGLGHLTAEAGPALFGPNLDTIDTVFYGALVRTTPETGCVPAAANAYRGKIAVARRGGCMFVEKTRHAAAAGAVAVIVIDNITQNTDRPGVFTMSGDGKDDVSIPTVFMHQRDGDNLLQAVANQPHSVAIQGTRWN